MPAVYPPYIFGMHDRGGEHLMQSKERPGWVLVTEAVGADPNNHGGSDYTDLVNKGLGVIARLNNGYGSAGTIPPSAQYDNFARRCGNFVEASPGCRIWIIGNEMNLANERPGGPNGQVITPQLYANCFQRCRAEIRRRPGHEDDLVVVGAVGPWNTQTKYAGNERGDWNQYFRDILNLLGDSVDGISLHTYTHGQEPDLVFSNATMPPPWQSHHWHFRVYRDFMAAIPVGLQDRPVFLTETDQYGDWLDQNTGWVRNVYKEIDDWNQDKNNQPIQAAILYRWIVGNPNDDQEVGWAITNKPGVQNDFRAAMNRPYQVVLPRIRPETLAAWLEVNAPTVMGPGSTVEFSVTVRNDGRLTWANSGAKAVRLGYRWIDAGGTIVEGERTDLPQPVATGQSVALPAMHVQAPDTPGFYRLELDLIEGASDWFSDQGSPIWQAEEVRIGARYRVAWLQVGALAEGTVGETVMVPVRVRNEGSITWPPAGERPVNLTYKWLDSNRNIVVGDGLRTFIGVEVPPLAELALNASVQFPAERGDYILQFDMVHEFVTWFQWKGSPVHELQIKAKPAVPDYAAEWIECIVPDRLVIGQVGSAIVEVKNVGSKAWPKSGADAVRLGYRWLDAQGQQVPLPETKTWPMPKSIEPGDVAIFRDIPFDGPQEKGSYRLVWDLKQGDTWLSSKGVAIVERSMQIVAPEYGVEWQVLTPWPSWMPPGKVQRTSLYLRNLGTRTWAACTDHPVHLAYTWFSEHGVLSEPWDTYRIPLPKDVISGDSVELLDVAFKTPSVLGNYTLRWDLVEEGATWFFRQGAAPLEVPVEIADRVVFVPWTAQASHNSEEVERAFDGQSETFWDSKAAQEPGMWFQVDLGQALVLDRVRVSSPGRGFPVGYKIKLSEDAQDWHLAAEKAQNWSDIDVAFAPCKARFVHLEQTSTPSYPASWMISEITVSATELWAGSKASHYTDDSHEAWDARLRTYWNTRAVKQKPGMWFMLDMGSLRRIESVELEHPQSQLPRGYVVSLSTNGQTWQEVGRNDDNWGKAAVSFDPAAARHIRVETTNSSPWHPWGISEFVVWRSSPVWLHGRES